MKIGIFGDSYATDQSGTWGDYLRLQKHDVTCFGATGSSIIYSARLIEDNTNFDFIIWCMTTPGRFSFQSEDLNEYIHTSSIIDSVKSRYRSSPMTLEQLEICKDYQTRIMDYDTEEFVGRCIGEAMIQKYPNLMIIPCFPSPLHLGFSLFDISQAELEIVDGQLDYRSGHLLPHNHQRLADIIIGNLRPGYFTTSLENFTS